MRNGGRFFLFLPLALADGSQFNFWFRVCTIYKIEGGQFAMVLLSIRENKSY